MTCWLHLHKLHPPLLVLITCIRYSFTSHPRCWLGIYRCQRAMLCFQWCGLNKNEENVFGQCELQRLISGGKHPATDTFCAVIPLKSENGLSCLGRHWQQSVCSVVWNGQAIKLKLPFSACLLTRLKHLQRAQFFPAPSLACVSSRWSLFSLRCFVGSPGKRRDRMGGAQG